jgi:hypothetical protein
MSAANQFLLLPYQLVQASLEACRILEYVGDEFPHEGFGFYGPQGFALRASIQSQSAPSAATIVPGPSVRDEVGSHSVSAGGAAQHTAGKLPKSATAVRNLLVILDCFPCREHPLSMDARIGYRNADPVLAWSLDGFFDSGIGLLAVLDANFLSMRMAPSTVP